MKRWFVMFWIGMVMSTGRAQEVPRSMRHLPDTHQTTSFTATFGEDADYTIHAPYFQVNGDGTLTDTITGLMWQQADGGEMTIESARIHVDTITVGGYSDWRLPNAQEAFSIMDLSANNPALDLNAFAPTDAEYWWTSDRQANDSNKVWVTNAGGGIGNHLRTETISAGGVKRFHVRAVRDVSAPDTLPSQFIHVQNGSATDTLTGLMWQRGHCPDTLTWENALIYADTLTVGGFSDWRLPNVKELRSISDVHLIGPCLDGGVFGNEGVRKYWSSTTLQSQPTKGWYLNTQFGITTYDLKTRRHDVRCVRGGEDPMTGVQPTPTGGADGGLDVWPNPFTDRVLVRFASNGGRVVITVSNDQGQQVWQVLDQVLPTGQHAEVIDLEELPAGVYYCLLRDGRRAEATHLVKVR